MNLILFTASYPYVIGGEQNFLEMELPSLVESFERVILVPERRQAQRMSYLSHLEVDDTYAEHLQSHGSITTFFRGLFSALLYKEITRKPWLLFKPTFIKRIIFFAGQAELTRCWVIAWIKKQNMEACNCLFYTYWFDQSALGIGLAKRHFPDLRLVVRAHGYDLYEDRRDPPYWPCREIALRTLDFLFPASDAGTDYLRKKYPEFAARIMTARLGVVDPGVLTRGSSDGIYRIVSCSKIVPVKRIALLMEGIKAAAKRRPNQRFEWRHFGTGPIGLELEESMKSLPANLAVNFVGYTTRVDLFDYYRENPVDVFVNVSASEGTPVAVMEAISCGIPVIATAVGGNGEIVSEKNGHLIAANPSPEKIADVLLTSWDQPGDRRAGSRDVWREKYNAEQNFAEFVNCLVKIGT